VRKQNTKMSYVKEFVWGNIDLICIFVLPIIIIFVVLWLCKKYNFSILPSNMKGKKFKKFKIPNLKRVSSSRGMQWEVDENDDFYEQEDEFLDDQNLGYKDKEYLRAKQNVMKHSIFKRNLYD
jgi:hypothetical protein